MSCKTKNTDQCLDNEESFEEDESLYQDLELLQQQSIVSSNFFQLFIILKKNYSYIWFRMFLILKN